VIRNQDFQHSGLTLRSTVHIPDSPPGTRWPTVILIHGFSANRLEFGSSFVHMSRLLERNGIASVRVDLSGHGESDGDFFDVTITGEIAETRSVVQVVRAFDFADPARIGLLGMSMGGVVAGIVAAEEPGIRALCLWSPAAVAPFEIGSGHLKGRNIAAQLEAKGYFDADGHRVSPALVEDITDLDVYGRARHYTAPSASSTATRTTSPPSPTPAATSTTTATRNSRSSPTPATAGPPSRTAPACISRLWSSSASTFSNEGIEVERLQPTPASAQWGDGAQNDGFR